MFLVSHPKPISMQSLVYLNYSLFKPPRADEKSKHLAHRKRPFAERSFAFKCPTREKKKTLFHPGAELDGLLVAGACGVSARRNVSDLKRWQKEPLGVGAGGHPGGPCQA